jgi:hypothetical protein
MNACASSSAVRGSRRAPRLWSLPSGLWAAALLAPLAPAVETEEEAAAGLPEPSGFASDLVSPSSALPGWTEADVREFELNGRPTNLGGGLWPAEAFPLEPVPQRLEPLPPPFSPDDLPLLANAPPFTPSAIPAQALATYFGARPDRYLLDPQGLVEDSDRANIERFLEYHADRGDLELFVLVIGPNQAPPVHISTRDLWHRWFPHGTREGAIVFYPIGEPDHAAVEFGRASVVASGLARLREALDACAKDSLQTTEPSAQLDRFCVQLSVQCAWLARDLGLHRSPAQPALTFIPEDAASRHGRSQWAAALLAAATASLAGLATYLWLTLARRPARFPDLEIPTRLGGDSCGGAHAVLSFGTGEG